MDIFGFDEKAFYKIRYDKLQRKNNIEYELNYQLNLLTQNNKMIIKIISFDERAVIIYRHMFDLPESEEYSIRLYKSDNLKRCRLSRAKTSGYNI